MSKVDHQLGARVLAARRALGLTQLQVAYRAGTSQPTLRMIEQFGALPNPALLERILAALGLDSEAPTPAAKRSPKKRAAVG